jgi:hypothetical protein
LPWKRIFLTTKSGVNPKREVRGTCLRKSKNPWLPFSFFWPDFLGWAEDLKVAPEREINDMDRQIQAATLALTLEDKLAGPKTQKT